MRRPGLLFCAALVGSAVAASCGTPAAKALDDGLAARVEVRPALPPQPPPLPPSPDAGPCPRPGAGVQCGVLPLAPEEALCATPRGDAEAEALALGADNAFVATEARYRQVYEALHYLRWAHPELKRVTARRAGVNGVVLKLEPYAAASLADGGEPLWDCLNRTYRVTQLEYLDWDKAWAGGYLRFPGQYDTEQLALEYRVVPGVEAADPLVRPGDGPTLCASPDGDGLYFLLDDASGDCSAGCTVRTYRGFTVGRDGGVAGLGTWDGRGAKPDWVSAHPDCRLRY